MNSLEKKSNTLISHPNGAWRWKWLKIEILRKKQKPPKLKDLQTRTESCHQIVIETKNKWTSLLLTLLLRFCLGLFFIRGARIRLRDIFICRISYVVRLTSTRVGVEMSRRSLRFEWITTMFTNYICFCNDKLMCWWEYFFFTSSIYMWGNLFSTHNVCSR